MQRLAPVPLVPRHVRLQASALKHHGHQLVGRRAMHAQAYLSGLGQQSFGLGHGRSVAAGVAGRQLWGLRIPSVHTYGCSS